MALTPGAVHPVTGTAELVIASPAALALQLDVPAQLGAEYGTPTRYFELGRATVGTADAWLAAFELVYADQLIWPLPPGCARLGLTLAIGATGTVTELAGDLVDVDCADQVAALQSALDASNVVLGLRDAEIVDLAEQIAELQSTGGGPAGPVISNLAYTTTPTTLTVTWDTDLPSDSQVEYGADASYGQLSALGAALVSAHSVTVSNLAPNASVHFRARSAAPIGSSSGDQVATTPADPTLLAQESLVAPLPGSNSYWYSSAPIPEADWPLSVTVHNDAAAGGGVISGPLVDNETGSVHFVGNWAGLLAPGQTWESGNIAWDSAMATSRVRVLLSSDGAHAIPWTVTLRRAS